MPRCNIREENPAKYAQVKAEQQYNTGTPVSLLRTQDRNPLTWDPWIRFYQVSELRGECRIPASIISFSMKPLK